MNASKLLNTKNGFGVTEFDILGDSHLTLRCGIQLALQYHSVFTHYRQVKRPNGATELHFVYYNTNEPGVVELPFPLKDVDAAVMFIASWLQEKGVVNVETQHGGDGSDSEGIRLTNIQDYDDAFNTDHLALKVAPEYVYYSK